jgi:predicted ATPase
VIALIGEAGVGKSRLVAEMRRWADADPAVLYLEGRCLEVTGDAGYSPYVDILRSLFSAETTQGDIVSELEIRRGLESLGLDAHQLGPFLAFAMSGRIGRAWSVRIDRLDAKQRKNETFLAFAKLFETLAYRSAVVIVLEDIHWADTLSLELTAFLMQRLASSAALLVCVFRPERGHRCWQLASTASRLHAEHYVEVRVRELDKEHSLELVARILGSPDLAPEARSLILRCAQGNPFYLEEVSRTLVESGTLRRGDEGWALEQRDFEILPETVQAVVLGRFHRLTREQQAVLETSRPAAPP